MEAVGDSARGGELAFCRLRLDGERIVDADCDGLDAPLRGLTLLEAAAVGGELLAVDALANAIGPGSAACSPRRTLVAMSGGVDSAAAAQLALDAGDEVVGVTLELWSDPAPTGSAACCSPAGRDRRPRARARHGHPAHHARPARAVPRRGRGPFIDGLRRGPTPNPCVRCNGSVRFDAMLELAGALGAARLATGHYARIARDEGGPLIRAARDPRKDQSYMLAKLDPALLDRLSFPLGGLTKDAVARARARAPGCRWPTSARARTSASSPGSAAARSSGVTRPSAAQAGRIVDGAGASSAATTASTSSRSASAAASASPPPSRCTSSRKDAGTNSVVVGPRDALATARVRLENARLHRPAEAAPRAASLPRRRRLPRGAAPAEASSWSSPSRPTESHRGSWPA